MKIIRFILINVLFSIAIITAVNAQKPVPESIVADGLKWISPAPIAGLQFTWIQGNETATELYVLRVRPACTSSN